MGSLAVHEKKGVVFLKVWCVPVTLPNPEEEPEQAAAAVRFMKTFKGLHGISKHETGPMLLCFTEIENARAAKWKLEEFTDCGLPIIEGTVTEDGKKLNCSRVLKD